MTSQEPQSNGVNFGTATVDPPNAASVQGQGISADEIALYDRQIRLWGVQAQEKIRSASILLINFKALGNEIAKNLVLAGISSLTVVDDGVVSEDDLCSQFFISEEDVGKNRAEAAAPQIRKLNPRVTLHVSTTNIAFQDPTYYAPFDLIIATDLDLDTLSSINASARLSARPFYSAGTHGLYGYIFADLVSHDFSIERSASNIKTTPLTVETNTRTIISVSTKPSSNPNQPAIETVTKREIYTPLPLANAAPLPSPLLSTARRLRAVPPLITLLRALWEFQRLSGSRLPQPNNRPDLELFTTLATESHRNLQLPAETLTSEALRSFLQNLGSELAPVTAVVGGRLSQDVINVLGKREQPIQNLCLFDGEGTTGAVYAMHPLITEVENGGVL